MSLPKLFNYFYVDYTGPEEEVLLVRAMQSSVLTKLYMYAIVLCGINKIVLKTN